MKNPLGITERACKKSDLKFFTGLIEKTLKKYVEVYVLFDKEHVKEGFFNRFKEIRILMKGRRRLGIYQLTVHDKNTLEITRLFLVPKYQGKGIGTMYMKYFEKLGYKRIILQVWENNPAKNLYKQLGYKTTMKKNHKIHMEKILK